MRNILKIIALLIILTSTIFSCDERYGIDSQTDKVVKNMTLVSDSIYYFEALNPREVVLSINSSTPWKSVSSENWLSVSPNMSDSSALITDVTIKIKENADSYKQRRATLTFSAEGVDGQQVVEVIQSGQVLLDVTPVVGVFSVTGEKKSFTVQSNREFIIETSAEWLSLSPMSGVPSDEKQSIAITASDNNGKPKRSANITVKTANDESSFEVKQDGVDLKIDGESEFLIPTVGSTVIVNLLATTNWSVNIPSDVEWITADVLNGNNDGSVSLTISKNPEYRERNIYVYFESAWPSLKDSVLITQKTDAIPITEEYFESNPSVVFNEDGSATLTAAPGSGSLYLKSKPFEFSYGKYTVNFSNIQIARTSSTMLMNLTTPDKHNEGISWGANASPNYTDGWASEYWVDAPFGSKKRQRVDNDILRGDIEKFVIDIKKSATPGKIDIDFYINNTLLISEQGDDAFPETMVLTFWTYNYYDKENEAIFEPSSFLYEPY